MDILDIKGFKMKKGFSLIEIGIVMIVIGILIAAVMKGKDVIKSAEIKQHNQTFLNKWVSVATTHFDKVGYNITGSSASGSMGVADGFADTNVSTVYGCNDLIDFAQKAGINLSTVIATNTGSPCRKTIAGEFSGDVEVAVGFENFIVTSTEENATRRNFVLFFNVPGDVALAFDRLIDSQADTQAGKVLVLEAYTTAKVSGDLLDDNLSQDSNGSTAIATANLNATDLHTVGVILEH